MKDEYGVKALAKMAGVSVRALHLYDKMRLLKPSTRKASGYRMYGEHELLRLQQILFYKELDFPLKEIKLILDNPGFDLITALNEHKTALTARRKRLETLINTIDHTINNLKNKTMSNYEQLYDGLPKELATAMHNEAIEKWGEESVTRSETALLKMSKADLERLKAEQKDIINQLRFKFLANEAVEGMITQEQITRHHANIRSFWGLPAHANLKAARYKGLAELYFADDRYITSAGKPDPDFALFLRNAMIYYADMNLE